MVKPLFFKGAFFFVTSKVDYFASSFKLKAMQYRNSIPALLLSIVLTSCGNSSADEKQPNITDTLAKPSTTAPATTTNQPGNVSVLPVSPATASTAGLNPEHGKPGHRCDIAVGAPLDSKPANPAPGTVTSVPSATPANNITINPTPAAPVAATAPSATAAGMNPAHGQPGHRCDIAVGAPLNSKPTGQATTTQPLSLQPSIPTATPVATPVAAPAAKTTTTPTVTAPGMNPAHGQPGHRCDIAVGAPLNSAPKTN